MMKYWWRVSSFACIALLTVSVSAVENPLLDVIELHSDRVFDRVVALRRDIHQYPELGNREFRTAKLIAKHLRELGLEVHTEIAHTGVVGILRGGQAGPMVALRADIDALPVTELTGLPFASKQTALYAGEEVGVMHACGHDAHTAILLGAASVLSSIRDQLVGDVLFIFQPAEEGPPSGEEGGAQLMLKEGLFDKYQPEAVFGLHVAPYASGMIMVREGITAAGSSSFELRVVGKQSHGAMPWLGIDPITLAGQITSAWQTIPTRYIDTMTAPTPVISVGRIRGGVRHNVIPDSVTLSGTMRYFNDGQREKLLTLMQGIAAGIAEPVGGRAEFTWKHGYIPTVNDPELTRKSRKFLHWAANGRLQEAPIARPAEDFSYFARRVPGMYFVLGAAPEGGDAAPNHSPLFVVDEEALRVGVRAMSALAAGFLQ